MNPDQTVAKKAVKSRDILLQYMLPKSIRRSRIEDDKSSDWCGKWVSTLSCKSTQMGILREHFVFGVSQSGTTQISLKPHVQNRRLERQHGCID